MEISQISLRNILFLASTLLLLKWPTNALSDSKYGENSLNRIINGTKAKMSSTKHQVSLRRSSERLDFFGFGHTCGGSLITYNVVLTAVHCFMNADQTDFDPIQKYFVVMGTLKRTTPDKYTIILNIKKRFLAVADFKDFRNSSYAKDVALLILDGYVPANHETVSPIRLNRKEIAGYTVCQATGWGINDENGELSVDLMTVDLPIIEESLCRREANFSNSTGVVIPLQSCMICAGYLYTGQRGTCKGDSGGPLVCNGLLTGVVSWGINCAESRRPSIFANVSYYVPWIEEQLQKEKIFLPRSGGDGSLIKNISYSVVILMLFLAIQ